MAEACLKKALPIFALALLGVSALHFTDVTEKSGVRFKHNSDPQKKYIVESMSGGVALFDYDNDGNIDAVSNNLDGSATVLRNDSKTNNNWITIKTAGAGKNRAGLGALVKVAAGDLVQVKEAHRRP